MKIKGFDEALETIRYEVDEEGHCGYIEDELRLAMTALEKQIPKKVILGYDEQDSICCPNCKGALMSMDWYDHWKCNYCEFCGQALDWSDVK